MATDRKYGLVRNDLSSHKTPVDYSQIRVGRTLLKDDAFLNTDYLKPKQRRMKRAQIERAIENQDIKQIRAISQYFFTTSGIYQRMCRYMAFLYTYDWFVTPVRYDASIPDGKVIEGFAKATRFLDNCELKKTFGNIALKVVKDELIVKFEI